MLLSAALFYIVAAAVAASAAAVVAFRSLVRAAVGLLFMLLGVAVLYFLLGAEFLGAVQLMVYVGGTLVLVVFGIMMTNTGPTLGQRVKGVEWLLGVGLAAGLFIALVAASLGLARPKQPAEPAPGIQQIGLSFLGIAEPGQTAYLLPFEIVSVHLLVVLVAAAYLARGKGKTPPPGPLPEAERGSSSSNPLRFGEGGSRSEPGGVARGTRSGEEGAP